MGAVLVSDVANSAISTAGDWQPNNAAVDNDTLRLGDAAHNILIDANTKIGGLDLNGLTPAGIIDVDDNNQGSMGSIGNGDWD
ncbi:MAG UNVERIFIED_CONTAM: hypothetical protein LVQ98_00180 [Rickettsiaceae bacterium]